EAAEKKTLLNEAFFRAAQKASSASTSQVAVVVLTDGRDENSSISLDQAIREAERRNVPVYTLGFGKDSDAKSLDQISTLTGGRFFPATDVRDLTALYLMLLRQLSNEYSLTFDIDVPSGDHELSVDLRYR